tara:strand:- start:122 stop:280 length:159 start_codon:yes stop_codon:yes gene_type:complete
MFVAGIFIDNQLAPQAHLSEGKFTTTSKKSSFPYQGKVDSPANDGEDGRDAC